MFYNKIIFKRCFYHTKKYWYKNLKQIPLFFKLTHYLIKHGYDEYATWMTFSWFIDTMKSILISYRKNHCGYPIDLENEEWNNIIDKMISLLDDMDEDNPKYNKGDFEEMYKSKDEFFKLFSKYFYNLWD